jgi:deoxyribose-phosphate aldolase
VARNSLTELAKTLEAVLLRPTTRADEIVAACAAAVQQHYAAVLVLPCWVAYARARLGRGDVRVAAAISFPFGADSAAVKRAAALEAVRDGADEIEVVAALPALANGDFHAARDELAAIVSAVRAQAQTGHEVLVKAIIETCYLGEREKRLAAKLIEMAGCDMAVTSTGVGPEGATSEDVALLRDALPAHVGIKAQGGVVVYADAQRLIDAGASRLGARDPAAILDEARAPRRR